MKPSLLLHSCCAPCSTTALRRLAESYSITIYYYNPNIDTIIEHDRRHTELAKLHALGIPFSIVTEPYSPKDYDAAVRGLEKLGEGSMRCHKCYSLRLEKTAQYATTHGFSAFTTTLSVSPHKNAAWLNEIGAKLAESYKVPYLSLDLKKQNGYTQSLATSAQLSLYRQSYCGCRYSLSESLARQKAK